MTTEAVAPTSTAVSGNPAVIRSVGKCFLLLIVSFGLWSLAWIYHTAEEVSPAAGEKASPGWRTVGFLVPIVNLFILFLSWRDVDNFAKRAGANGFSVILYFLLTLFIPFAAIFTYISVQGKLNAAWEQSTGGQATDAPMQPVDWFFIFIGWAFLALAIIVGVAAG